MTRSGTSNAAWMVAAASTFSALVHHAGYPRIPAWFSFIVLALVGHLFLGALMFVVRFVRASGGGSIPRALGILALALIASGAVVVGRGLAPLMFYPSSGQDMDGDFVVRKWLRPDSDGHTEIRALYFRGRKVTPWLERYVRHPTQPAVVIFEQSEFDGSVVTYAFNGATFWTLRLASGYAVPSADQWSPDKSRAILYGKDGFYVFDVARWRVSRPRQPVLGASWTPMFFWSPDSRRFAQIDPGMPPHPNSQPVVLKEWDAETLIPRIVGCMPNSRGWYDSDFSWQDDSLVVAEEASRYHAPCPEGRR